MSRSAIELFGFHFFSFFFCGKIPSVSVSWPHTDQSCLVGCFSFSNSVIGKLMLNCISLNLWRGRLPDTTKSENNSTKNYGSNFIYRRRYQDHIKMQFIHFFKIRKSIYNFFTTTFKQDDTLCRKLSKLSAALRWSQFMINASARMFVKLNFKFPCAHKFMARYFPRRFQLNLQAKFIVLHVYEAIQYRKLFTRLADVRTTITKDNVCCRKENKRSEDKWKSHDWIERKTQTVFLCNLLGVQTRSCKKCCSRRDLTWSD